MTERVDLATKHEQLKRLYEQCAEQRAMWFKAAKESEKRAETLVAEVVRLKQELEVSRSKRCPICSHSEGRQPYGK